MKITHIEYGESLQTGYDSWKRLTLRVELLEGDDIEYSQENLIKMVSERMAKFIEIEQESKKQSYFKEKTTPDSITATIEAINSCKTEEELKGFWMISKSNLMLVEAYNKKLNQLTNK